MRLTSRSHTVIATLSLCCLLVFLKLGNTEIQPWDEGLYALRAKSILLFGAFWDQARYAAGGMYSATYPPLTVWIMSLFMSVFGENSLFAIRLYPAICSCISIVTIHFLARRIVSWEMSLVASALLAATTSWNYLARHAMLDVPLMMYCMLSLLAVIKIIELKDRKKIFLWTIIFGLSFGAALLTKIIISFIPILLIIPYLQQKPADKKKFLFSGIILGLSLALPWYASMILRHGAEFTNSFTVPHMYSTVEGNYRPLGIFYYVNQLLVANPVFLFSFVFTGFFFFKKINREPKNIFLERAALLWFISTFVIFSIAATKMPHYAVYMIPPAVLLTVRGYEEIATRFSSHRLVWTALAVVVTLTIWALVPQVRLSFRGIFFGEGNFSGFFFLVCALVIFILGWMMPSRRVMDSVIGMFFWSSMVLPAILLMRVAYLNATEPKRYYTNVAEVAEILKTKNPDDFVYLYHQHNPADSLNPQLSWYLDGWMTGWLPNKKYTPVAMPETTIDPTALRKLENQAGKIIVYYSNTPESKLSQSIIRELEQGRGNALLSTPEYFLFGPMLYYRGYKL